MTNKPIRMDLEAAKQFADENEVTFLDVVDSSHYDALDYQIKGAVRIEPRNIKDEYGKLPKDRAVLAYWTWPNAETSASVALYLRRNDYEAFAIDGGLEAWKEAGYPVEDKE